MVDSIIHAKYQDTLAIAKNLEKNLLSFNISKTQEKVVLQLYSALIRVMEDYKKIEGTYGSFFIGKAFIEIAAHLRLSYQDKSYAYFRQWSYFNDIERKIKLSKNSTDPLLQEFFSRMANTEDDIKEIKKVIESVVPIKDLEKRYSKSDAFLTDTNLYEIYSFLFHNLSLCAHTEFFPVEDIFEKSLIKQLSLIVQELFQQETDRVSTFFRM